MRVIGVHECLQQLRKDLLESRYGDAILLQERKKGLNRVKIDQVFRVPNSHNRPIQVSVPIFANELAHHGCQLRQCHSTEVKLERISRPHEVAETIHPVSTASATVPASLLQSDSFRSQHRPEGDHFSVDRDLNPRSVWIGLVDVLT